MGAYLGAAASRDEYASGAAAAAAFDLHATLMANTILQSQLELEARHVQEFFAATGERCESLGFRLQLEEAAGAASGRFS